MIPRNEPTWGRCDVDLRPPFGHEKYIERWRQWRAPVEMTLAERVQVLEKEVNELRARLFDEATQQEAPVFSLPSDLTTQQLEECEKMIMDELDKVEGMYPSDFAEKYDLDPRLVFVAFAELQQSGKIEPSSPRKANRNG